MKRLFLSLCFLSCLFLVGNMYAQQNDDKTSHGVVIIKTSDDDGTVTVKKKRLEKGQSINEYVEALDLKDSGNNVEVIISSTGDEKSSGENLFMFKSNKQCIKINGDGDWQEALIDFDFDFDDLHEAHDHHRKVHFQKENDVLLGVYPDSGDEGVHIDGIVVGSGADKAGLKKNDIMTAINGITIRSTDDLHNELGQYKAGDVVVIDVQRDGQPLVISSTLTAREKTLYRKSERDPCKVFFGVYVGSWGQGERRSRRIRHH